MNRSKTLADIDDVLSEIDSTIREASTVSLKVKVDRLMDSAAPGDEYCTIDCATGHEVDEAKFNLGSFFAAQRYDMGLWNPGSHNRDVYDNPPDDVVPVYSDEYPELVGNDGEPQPQPQPQPNYLTPTYRFITSPQVAYDGMRIVSNHQFPLVWNTENFVIQYTIGGSNWNIWQHQYENLEEVVPPRDIPMPDRIDAIRYLNNSIADIRRRERNLIRRLGRAQFGRS